MTPDRSLTLEAFVPTAGNGRALAACCALTAQTSAPVSPVLLCGPVASGKTHLLHAVANELARTGRNTLLTTCDIWFTDRVAALSDNPRAENRFRERHAALDGLLLDDARVFAGMPATQQELALCVAQLALRGRPVVLTLGGSSTLLRPLLRRFRQVTGGNPSFQIVHLAKPTSREMEAILGARFGTVPLSVIHRASLDARDLRAATGAMNGEMARRDLHAAG